MYFDEQIILNKINYIIDSNSSNYKGNASDLIKLITVNKNINNYSVFFLERLFLRLDEKSFEFNDYKNITLPSEAVKQKNKWVKIKYNLLDTFLYDNLIFKLITNQDNILWGEQFDCCHLYQECSDNGFCINKNIKNARSCTYRLKLLQGIKFY